MTPRHKLAAFLLAAVFWAHPVQAIETYVKLQTIVLEVWDQDGLFHMVVLEMVVAMPDNGRINKSVSFKIQQQLQTYPYEELQKPEAAAMIKETALDIVRAEPDGARARDVLINKFQFR